MSKTKYVPGKMEVKPNDDVDLRGTFDLYTDKGGYVCVVNRVCMNGDDCMMDEQVNKANADRIALCWNMHDALMNIARAIASPCKDGAGEYTVKIPDGVQMTKLLVAAVKAIDKADGRKS